MFVRCFLQIILLISICFGGENQNYPISRISQVTSIPYKISSDLNQLVRQHVYNQDIYISPLALLDMNRMNLTDNQTILSIPLILYTDEQLEFIRQHNLKQCQSNTTKCLFHKLSPLTMRILYKDILDQPNEISSYYQYIKTISVKTDPSNNQDLLQVNFHCRSTDACLQLTKIFAQSNKPLGLHIDYAVQQPKQRQINFNTTHSFRYLFENDADSYVQELIHQADIRHISSIDLTRLKDSIREQLFGNHVIFTDENDEQQWNQTYWPKQSSIPKPNRIFRVLKRRLSNHCSSLRNLSINMTDQEIDKYIQQTYTSRSYDLFKKYRQLFEFKRINCSQATIKLKSMRAFDLNLTIEETIHMSKPENIYSIPIQIKQANIFRDPYGIYIDDDKDESIYIADYGNHRIVKWDHESKTGQVVAGGNGPGKASNQLNEPRDVIIDKQTNNSFIICEHGNRRLVRWSRLNNTILEVLIPNITCSSIRMDRNGDVYVANQKQERVTKWTMKTIKGRGVVVAGGFGQGNRLNQFNGSVFIHVDRNRSIYVSDKYNHRVMKWNRGAKEGIVVAGGNGFGKGLNQLRLPQGIVVDRHGNVYVADTLNHRVMLWPPGAKQGVIIASGLNKPVGLALNRHGDLYVVDSNNHRVLKIK